MLFGCTDREVSVANWSLLPFSRLAESGFSRLIVGSLLVVEARKE